ncbi:isoaspartyl peptidase/L-asparaginase family protein [Bacteroidota bacterium]
MNKIAIAIHGGAGTILKKNITSEQEVAYKKDLKHALNVGYAALEQNKTAVEAVELSIIEMENSPLFNAGKGSVFTNKGTHEMDASIMEGKTLHAGAVALVHNIKNPISLARLIMEKSEHVMLAGEGAIEFAKKMECKFEQDRYFYDEFRYQQWLDLKGSDKVQLDHSVNKKIGTIGAVAFDVFGNLAAGTSTGGVTNKKIGRIGDSPIIGVGTYANNNSCAISCTGTGEFFIRGVVAYDISCLMEYKGMSIDDACDEVVNKKLLKLGGDGGLIAVDLNGNIAISFNTEGMYRAYKQADSAEVIAIYKE